MWKDYQRWELMGLLDDRGLEFLRDNHKEVYDALRDHEHTDGNVDPELVVEFDIALEWMLRSTGIPV